MSTRSVLGDSDNMHAVMVMSSKGLNRNLDQITRFIEETMESPDFSEVDRIGDLISQSRARVEGSIAGRGHSLASSAASSRMSASAALNNQWSGLEAISFLKELDDRIQKDKSELNVLTDKFRQIHDKICNSPREWLIVSEEEQQAEIEKAIAASKLGVNEQTIEPFSHRAGSGTVKQAWSANAQVNYCAQAHATVASGHEDAASLTVLGEYLSNGFLHSAVREKGGAYGGGAGYDGESGAFRFYSYRDPRLQETYADFDSSVEWMLKEKHEERLLEEAILGIIGRIDKPGSPAGEAIGNYYSERFGRGADYTTKIRKRILGVSLDDLKSVTERYLTGGDACYAVVGPADKLDSLADFEKFSV